MEQRLDPLFRWPGGKRWLVPRLRSLVPESYGTYYEPFFGGGALFFSLLPSTAVISDLNADLMNFYRVVRDSPTSLIEALRSWDQDRATYERVRAIQTRRQAVRAARHIYLAKLAFNGIYRVNRAGVFNVPPSGRRFDVTVVETRLPMYAHALAKVTIRSGDFRAALRGVVEGDFVYLDPPYTVAHNNNGFVKYNRKLFSWRDQVRLSLTAEQLRRRGAHVIVSAPFHDTVRKLYPEFEPVRVRRQSVISASAEGRRSVEEYVLVGVK